MNVLNLLIDDTAAKSLIHSQKRTSLANMRPSYAYEIAALFIGTTFCRQNECKKFCA
jgi:hypothetical protein